MYVSTCNFDWAFSSFLDFFRAVGSLDPGSQRPVPWQLFIYDVLKDEGGWVRTEVPLLTVLEATRE